MSNHTAAHRDEWHRIIFVILSYVSLKHRNTGNAPGWVPHQPHPYESTQLVLFLRKHCMIILSKHVCQKPGHGFFFLFSWSACLKRIGLAALTVDDSIGENGQHGVLLRKELDGRETWGNIHHIRRKLFPLSDASRGRAPHMSSCKKHTLGRFFIYIYIYTQ